MAAPILPLVALAALGAAALALGGGKTDPFKGKATSVKATHLFDANETPAQADAVQTALSLETDPAKLDAFANALAQAGFPNSAKALHDRAAALRAANPAGPQAPPVQPSPPSPAPPPPPLPPGPSLGQPAPVILPQMVVTPSPTPVVISPPAALPAPPAATGIPMVVTTSDPSPAGDLNMRDAPDPNANVVMSIPKGSTVLVTGAQQNGFFPVNFNGQDGFASAQFLKPVTAAAAAQVLPSGTIVQTTSTPVDSGGPLMQVTTSDPSPAGDLNMRSAPSTSASVVMSIPKDSQVTVTGPEQNGFMPVTFNGQSGFASSAFLSPVTSDQAPGVTAGFHPAFRAHNDAPGYMADYTAGFHPGHRENNDPGYSFAAGYMSPARASATKHLHDHMHREHARAMHAAGMIRTGFHPGHRQEMYEAPQFGHYTAGYMPEAPAGYSLPQAPVYLGRAGRGNLTSGFDDSQELAASGHELAQSLGAHSCRAYDEPIVRRFQLAAKAAGLYAGKANGAYDEMTRAALVKVVGPQAPPACFAASGAGGPKNFDTYWSTRG